MGPQQFDIEKIVDEVIKRIGEEQVKSSQPSASVFGKAAETPPFDLDALIEMSRKGHKDFQSMGVEFRKVAISAIRQASVQSAKSLGEMAVKETGLGKMPDKMEKVLLAARKTPGVEDIVPTAITGDNGLTLTEFAPYGVVGSITPSTNPPSTIVNNSISALAGGNSIIFNPHPSAKGVSRATAKALQKAILDVGGPDNLIISIAEPTIQTGKDMMTHPGIDLLAITGGEAVVKLGITSGKKAICAGPGNPPVIVDETADLTNAAKHIVTGGSFDNNVLCVAEKEVFVVESVADKLKEEMLKVGAFEITGDQIKALTNLLIAEDKAGKGERHPVMNKEWIGKDAVVLLEGIGITPPSDVKLVVFEAEWDHPVVMAEQLTPALPIVRVPSFEEAMRLAIIVEHGFRHSFMMHSTNINNLSIMAQACNANVFVKNGPSLAGLGYEGEGYTSLTIAGTTGEGLTSARSFVRPRRCVLVDSFRIV